MAGAYNHNELFRTKPEHHAHTHDLLVLSLTHGASKCFSAGQAVATTEFKKPFLLG